MKIIVALATCLLVGCASEPKKETTFDDKVLQVRTYVFDTAVCIMSLGDPRCSESYGILTPEKKKLFEGNPQIGAESKDTGN